MSEDTEAKNFKFNLVSDETYINGGILESRHIKAAAQCEVTWDILIYFKEYIDKNYPNTTTCEIRCPYGIKIK